MDDVKFMNVNFVWHRVAQNISEQDGELDV